MPGKGLRNRNHAVGQRHKAFDKRFAVVRNPRQRNLRRPAADVKHQHALDIAVQERQTPDHRQPRLFLRRDNLKLNPRLALGHFRKLRHVLRPPARRRRYKARRRNRHIFVNNPAADFQRLNRAAHRLGRQLVVLNNPLAEAHHFGKSFHHAERSRRRRRHHQPARVGAEVNRGVVVLRQPRIAVALADFPARPVVLSLRINILRTPTAFVFPRRAVSACPVGSVLPHAAKTSRRFFIFILFR